MNGSLGSLIILLYNIYFTISFYTYVYIYRFLNILYIVEI